MGPVADCCALKKNDLRWSEWGINYKRRGHDEVMNQLACFCLWSWFTCWSCFGSFCYELDERAIRTENSHLQYSHLVVRR